MIYARCTKTLCKICHGHLLDRLVASGNHNYADMTASFLSRAKASTPFRNNANRSEIARQQLRKKVFPSGSRPKPKRNNFLSLPSEIRVAVYAECMTTSDDADGTLIYGWIEGGGQHPDFPIPCIARCLTLYADRRFPTQLLVLCKAIYKEAKLELYRNISVKMIPPAPNYTPQVNYWLKEHPIRFTQHLSIPFKVNLFKGFRGVKLSKEEATALGIAIGRMPHLLQLDLVIILDGVYEWRIPTIKVQLTKQKMTRLFSSILSMKAAIPQKRIRIRFDIRLPKYSSSPWSPSVPVRGLEIISIVKAFLASNDVVCTNESIYKQYKGSMSVDDVWGI
jgi:hypothetical protein